LQRRDVVPPQLAVGEQVRKADRLVGRQPAMRQLRRNGQPFVEREQLLTEGMCVHSP